VEAKDRDCRAVERGKELAQGFRAQKRRVAEDDEEIVAACDGCAGSEDGMRGPAALGLNEYLRGRREPANFGGDIAPIRPDDHGQPVASGIADRRDRMADQRLPGDPVQHLRRRGRHARAFACSEHNGGSLRHRTSCRPGGRQRFSPWPLPPIAKTRPAPTLLDSPLD
jgi:hypothetical protein